MSANTSIAWTHHTFNPWWGCTKVSPGCDNCYAERDSKRYAAGKVLWGVDAERRTFGDKHWDSPRRWNARAADLHTGPLRKPFEPGVPRPRVFCASMADVFDNHETANRLRPRLWELIRDTPFLDWQILTKRIGNAKAMLPPDWGDGYPNVWLGASIVTQLEADRDIPKLLATPARIRFLSCEPLLEPLDLERVLWPNKGGHRVDVLRRGYWNKAGCMAGGPSAKLGKPKGGFTNHSDMSAGVDWVIVGGESGPKARPFNVQWARDIIAQCRAAGVPVFVKQLGALAYDGAQQSCNAAECCVHDYTKLRLSDRAGGDPSEWPEDLRAQEFPR